MVTAQAGISGLSLGTMKDDVTQTSKEAVLLGNGQTGGETEGQTVSLVPHEAQRQGHEAGGLLELTSGLE